MEGKLFTELRPLYSTSKERPDVIRIKIRMRDLIDQKALSHAVDTTMRRYPYFCVELQKDEKEKQYVFIENHRPVIITNSLKGVELNSEASNYHMIAFAWQDNWIVLDIFHGMTDGAGAYEVIKTLLYYYCSERYNIQFHSRDGIRLSGDFISEEEWIDPAAKSTNLPEPRQLDVPKALNLMETAGLTEAPSGIVYSVGISEAEFMKFNVENGGTPGTMVSLFLSRAIAKLFPDNKAPIRITLCVNQRKALNAPLAHHSLVGGVMLEYKEEMRYWPITKQIRAYRDSVSAQTQEEIVLAGVAAQKKINQTILSKETDQERTGVVAYIDNFANQILTAVVSYVGKANYQEAEKYIRDFRLWTFKPVNRILIEISVANGMFNLDFVQPFTSPIYVNAFLRELDENGIDYDLKDVNELELPNIKVPWID
ncbi:MAG: hypothetical protein IJR11_03585 [Synergistaceae bacterium]|nr:hypothetical protein [Synergistaceae bacterium]